MYVIECLVIGREIDQGEGVIGSIVQGNRINAPSICHTLPHLETCN